MDSREERGEEVWKGQWVADGYDGGGGGGCFHSNKDVAS